MPTPPTALFTTNNRITIGALRAMRVTSADTALVGFDDFELADLLGVSVIAHSPERMGELGAEKLLARLADPNAGAAPELLPVELIERGSGERRPSGARRSTKSGTTPKRKAV